jgi:hypothetical protein
MEEEELRTITKQKYETMERTLPLLSKHPQILQAGIGAEKFAEGFIEAFTKYNEYKKKKKTSIEKMPESITGFPHIIQSGIKTEEFLEEMNKASERFFEFFKTPCQ